MKYALPVLLILGFLLIVRSGSTGMQEPGSQTHHEQTSAHAPGAQPRPSRPRASTSTSTGPVTSRTTEELDPQALATSLQGTDVDGVLAADADDNLVLCLGVRDYFDYFLSIVDEVPLARVVAFMDAYARQRLPARAADQLMALLDDYLAYQQSAQTLMQTRLLPAEMQSKEYYLQALEQAFEQLAKLRRMHMSPEAVEEFFGLEEKYERYTLDRMHIETDPDLDATDKAVLVAMLRDSLPEPLRASENRHAEQAERSQAIRAIIESSASAEEKRAALAQYHDPETVDRIMRYLERKQAQPSPHS